jgi:hypothetical protein
MTPGYAMSPKTCSCSFCGRPAPLTKYLLSPEDMKRRKLSRLGLAGSDWLLGLSVLGERWLQDRDHERALSRLEPLLEEAFSGNDPDQRAASLELLGWIAAEAPRAKARLRALAARHEEARRALQDLEPER